MDDDSLNGHEVADVIQSLPTTKLVVRSVFGGTLMGLANLVPGISGGTMLLAAGIYPSFIQGVAEVTRFRFRWRTMLVLGFVGCAALLAILLGAGQLKALVVGHRWVMYSLFIGLTLGGVPVVWRLARPVSWGLITAAGSAFLLMALLATLQARGVIGTPQESSAMLFAAGLAGASAMILPGVSGGYLLLLMGQYVPILSAIDQFKEALKVRDMAAAWGPAFSVLLPVGLGVVSGVVVVGNLLQWLLKHHRKPTLGALLGLLLGSTVGLFPFQRGIPPQPGQVIKGQRVTTENIASFEEDDWNTEYFRPPPLQVAVAAMLMAAGLLTTVAITKVGGQDAPGEDPVATGGDCSGDDS